MLIFIIKLMPRLREKDAQKMLWWTSDFAESWLLQICNTALYGYLKYEEIPPKLKESILRAWDVFVPHRES